MRAILTLLIACAMTVPMTVVADHDGRPHEKDSCQPGERRTCTDVNAGTMECLPEAGRANDLAVVVGSADNGVFSLHATGINHVDSNAGCVFEIRVDAQNIQFNEGWAPGILAPYGGASVVSSSPCFAIPGETCEASTSFSWWRAVHGVTFDVPFDLVVNGVVVASGRCHYYDPPLVDEVAGGPVTL